MAQIHIGHVQTVLRSGAGDQDITLTGFGTPKAVLITMARTVVHNGRRDHACESLGFSDGINQFVTAWLSEEGVTTSDTRSAFGNTDLVCEPSATNNTVAGLARWTSWITDGVRINVGNAFTQQWQIGVWLFGGVDLQADVFETTFNATVGGTVVITDPGFPPDFMFWMGTGNQVFTSGPTVVNGAIAMKGICATDGSTIQQISHGRADRDNVGTTQVAGVCSNSRILHRMQHAAPGFSADYELTARSATGVTVTTRRENFGMEAACLALGLGGAKVWAGVLLTPTATGTQTVTQAPSAFEHMPQVAFAIGSSLTLLDTVNEGNNGACGFIGASMAYGLEEFSCNPICRDNISVTATVNYTYSQADFVHNRNAADNDAVQSTIENHANGQFNVDGFDHEFTNVLGQAKQFFYATIEEALVFLKGTVQTTADGTGELDKRPGLRGQPQVSADGQASMDKRPGLNGSAQARADGQATADKRPGLRGSAQARADPQAALDRRPGLEGRIDARADLQGSLDLLLALEGRAAATADGQGAAGLLRALEGVGATYVDARAMLAVTGAVGVSSSRRGQNAAGGSVFGMNAAGGSQRGQNAAGGSIAGADSGGVG